jgi:Rad3-related DNA helicase
VPVAYNQLTLQIDQKSQTTVFDSVDPKFRTNKRFNNILTKLSGLIPEFSDLIKRLDDRLKDCRQTLKILFENLAEQHASDFNLEAVYSEKIIVRNLNESYGSLTGEINQLDTDIRNILSLLDKFNALLTSKDPEKEDYPELFQAFQKHTDLLTGSLHNISSLFLEQLDNWIYWKEGQFKLDKNQINQLQLSLHACPVDVSEPLSKLLFKRIDHCVLTSATLRVDDTFEYFSQRTGLDQLSSKSIKSAQFLSPFYYDDQVTYLQYGGNANISNNPQAIASIIYKSHKSNNKRIMALFTSRNALSNTDAKLRLLGGNDLPIFSQKNNVSRQSLISGMRNTSNGILLGTSSFWEGVDLPGDLLEVLIITKIPFDVPTEPSIKAYSEMIDQSGGNSFMDYSIPEAVIKFRQGFGRLIRTISDEGTFMNLDNRVLTRSYGKHFSDAIPVTMKVFTNLDTDF